MNCLLCSLLTGCNIDKNKNSPMLTAFDIQPVTTAQEAEEWSSLNDKITKPENKSKVQSENKQADSTKTNSASADNKTTTEKDKDKKEDKTKTRPEEQNKTNKKDRTAVKQAEQDRRQEIVDSKDSPWYKKIGAKISKDVNSMRDWSSETLSNKDSAWYKKAGAKVVSWLF